MRYAATLAKPLLSTLASWSISRLLWFQWLSLVFLIMCLHGKTMTNMWCLPHSICFGPPWYWKFGSGFAPSWHTAGGRCWWNDSLKNQGQASMVPWASIPSLGGRNQYTQVLRDRYGFISCPYHLCAFASTSHCTWWWFILTWNSGLWIIMKRMSLTSAAWCSLCLVSYMLLWLKLWTVSIGVLLNS